MDINLFSRMEIFLMIISIRAHMRISRVNYARITARFASFYYAVKRMQTCLHVAQSHSFLRLSMPRRRAFFSSSRLIGFDGADLARNVRRLERSSVFKRDN